MASEHSGEVDLIDVWLAISRHFRLFLAVSSILFIAGLIVAFTRTSSYNYSVTIQIGGMRDKSAFDLVEKPESVIATLENSIIPTVLQRYANANPNSRLALIKIAVKNPINSDVVVLTARGTAQDQNQIEGILKSVVNELDASHSTLLEEHVDATKKLLTNEITSAQSEIDKLKKSRERIVSDGDSGSKALTLLLIDDQVANLQKDLFDLRKDLEVGLVADIRFTHPVNSPQRSLMPAGIGRSLLVLLSFIFSIVIGLLFVFAARMLELAKERINATS